jgi:hypothetical protein
VTAASTGGARPDAPSGGDSSPAAPPEAPSVPIASSARGRARRLLGRAATGLAGGVLAVALLAPGPEHGQPAALLRLPVEGLLGLGLVLAVPARWRGRVAGLVGGALGLGVVLRIVDVGFHRVLSRPFDPVLDWSFLSSGVTVLQKSMGTVGAAGVVVAAALVALAVVAVVAWAGRRLGLLAARHRHRLAPVAGGLGLAWLVFAVTGAQVVDGVPVAARDYVERLGHLATSLRDGAVYQKALADDPYRDVPGDALLSALRGKDVVIVLVESYGRVALDHPAIAPTVTRVLTTGADRLAAAGFSARSGFLTSPTVGGGSWLASASLLSGTWVSNQRRYEALGASDRLRLTGAFQRAGWHTVALMPGVTQPWPEPERSYYGFDEIHAFDDLGYAGALFSFDSIPDQYVLSVLARTALRPAPRPPVMAVVTLISSHAPWAPVPPLLDWDAIGDGSRYAEPAEQRQPAEIVLRRDPERVRADYARSLEYSLSTVISYIETYGDDDLVLVVLGDHQPVPAVTGPTANRDVPVSLVTRDETVLARIAGWGWVEGLVPTEWAAVWPMSEFRDRFLAAFS